MRGIPSLITDIRKQVFTEVARMAYSGDYTQMEDIPFRIVPGQSPLTQRSRCRGICLHTGRICRRGGWI